MPIFKGLRGRVILVVIVLAIIVAVPTIALAYVYTSTPLAKVTVTGGAATFEQGTVGDQGTIGDIGFSPQSFGGSDGFPLTLAASGSFRIGVALLNSDNVSHSLDAIHVEAPFTLANSSLPVPLDVPPGYDTILYLTLDAPTASGTYAFGVTLVSYH